MRGQPHDMFSRKTLRPKTGDQKRALQSEKREAACPLPLSLRYSFYLVCWNTCAGALRCQVRRSYIVACLAVRKPRLNLHKEATGRGLRDYKKRGMTHVLATYCSSSYHCLTTIRWEILSQNYPAEPFFKCYPIETMKYYMFSSLAMILGYFITQNR